MGLLKQLFRQSPEKYEQKGDELTQNSLWGMAKIEYEKALYALEKQPHDHREAETRLQEKLFTTKEALAFEHKQTGKDLVEAEQYDQARELFELAIELSEDHTLIAEIQELLEEIKNLRAGTIQIDMFKPEVSIQVDDDMATPEMTDEDFTALCGILPEKVRRAYKAYGKSFKSGYMALNRGEFGFAVDELSRAMNEHPSPDSYIPLELATAYFNLGKLDESRTLLESFLRYHPDALPGYQVLCEVLWEMNAYDDAETLLSECPEELKDSVAYHLLRGETMFHAEKYSEAITLYQGFLEKFGWNEGIAKALAGAFETSGNIEGARKLYQDIMNQCSSCHSPVDPLVKRKFSDLSFDLGQRSLSILEIYLSLAQEDGKNAPYYYERVSQIYTALGNEEEARRFQAFAELAQMEKE